MLPKQLDGATLTKLQEITETIFGMRDEMYTAAQFLDNEDHQQVCRRLAEHLGGHAAELQQILMANGAQPRGPLEMHAIAAPLVESIRANRGAPGVLSIAERFERELKDEYGRMIEEAPDEEVKGMLRRQRDEVEFGERVLRGMGGAGLPRDDADLQR